MLILVEGGSCCLPITNLPILILISKVEHLVNVLFLHRHRQVPHHELEVSLGEEFVLDFILFGSEVGGVWICATNNLNTNVFYLIYGTAYSMPHKPHQLN